MNNDLAAVRTTIEHITGGWRAQALYVAVKLGLPDHVEAGLATNRQLAEVAGAEEEGIRRLMRLLVSMGFFEGNGTDGYRNTAVSRTLLDRPGSLRDMCLLNGEEYYTAWGRAETAISKLRSGFELEFGQSFYTFLGQDRGLSSRFQGAMKAGNGFFHAVPEVFDFDGKHVVDIGGGSGELLSIILGAAPDARGTLMDLPHVVTAARDRLPEVVGAGRIDFFEGDMFEGVPHGGDVYVLCRVFGAYSDEAIALMLKDIRQSMKGPSSRLLLLDRFVEDENCPLLSATWDLHLLMMLGGGHRPLSSILSVLEQADLYVEQTAELPFDNTALIVAAR